MLVSCTQYLCSRCGAIYNPYTVGVFVNHGVPVLLVASKRMHTIFLWTYCRIGKNCCNRLRSLDDWKNIILIIKTQDNLLDNEDTRPKTLYSIIIAGVWRPLVFPAHRDPWIYLLYDYFRNTVLICIGFELTILTLLSLPTH